MARNTSDERMKALMALSEAMKRGDAESAAMWRRRLDQLARDVPTKRDVERARQKGKE